MQKVQDEVVRRLYSNIALGEDIGAALEPIASSFHEAMFCYKSLSINTLDYHHLRFLNVGEEIGKDMIAAGCCNPFPELARIAPMNELIHSEDFIRPEEVRASEFYELVFKKHNTFDRTRGFMIHRQGVDVAMASVAIASDFGGSDSESLNNALEFVRPHFQNAFSIAMHLEQRRSDFVSYSFWLEQIPTAAFILDQGMHVAFANKQAETLFTSSASLNVDCRNEITSRHNGHRKLLEDAVIQCRLNNKSLGPVVLEMEAAPNPFFVVMPVDVFAETPVHLAQFVRGPQPLLCMVLDPGDLPVAELDNLQQYFGISSREAELVQYLVRGASVGETSDAMEISYNTARNHMARIANKVSAGSQSELVRLASDLAARVPR
ncbi:helix-turn-helix transcriptional regulator [Pseudovibrio sp. Tun.PSC04-5.I4]|uniref:helix-turn-helix transcriptional regulator n=1 Tax=Pseudovibrio sp. Tun.PSC04-5.I4 TaxID=1798213 RepID=UPI00088A9E79|nr:helix-turn-helix transcriptional regulator [Pseudovibrio sp. Tun.PSC04-5.I4]SDR30376.1 DNA-binding transcriptional regulator, CsgD family [Pseudovibrio sp. Tun.PSC04-5.I4]